MRRTLNFEADEWTQIWFIKMLVRVRACRKNRDTVNAKRNGIILYRKTSYNVSKLMEQDSKQKDNWPGGRTDITWFLTVWQAFWTDKTRFSEHEGQCWNFWTIYGGWEPSRNRVVVPARQTTRAGRIGSLESILEIHKCQKIPPQVSEQTEQASEQKNQVWKQI